MSGDESALRSVCDYADETDLREALMRSSSTALRDWVLPCIDVDSSRPQTMEAEVARLLALKSYAILDSDPEESFDRLTRLATKLFGTPIALVNIIDLGRQWFKSVVGFEGRETSRQLAFCAHTVLSTKEVMVIPDATKDVRFQSNPFVSGPPHIRFHAGAPLISPEGYKLGTFCINDYAPRPHGLTAEECTSLQDLAATVVQLMVARRQLAVVCPTRVAILAHALNTPLTGVQLPLALLQQEDEELLSTTTTSNNLHQQQTKGSDLLDLLRTATQSTQLIADICKTTFDTLRTSSSHLDTALPCSTATMSTVVHIPTLVESLRSILVPFVVQRIDVSIDPSLPATCVANQLCVLRSCLNLVTLALEQQTPSPADRHQERCSSVQLSLAATEDATYITFECQPRRTDHGSSSANAAVAPTETGLDAKVPATTVGEGSASAGAMASLAMHVKQLNGTYGHHRKAVAAFCVIWWFRIPLAATILAWTEESSSSRRPSTNTPLYFQ